MRHLFFYIFLLTAINIRPIAASDLKTQPSISSDSRSLYGKAYIISELLYNPATASYTLIKDENKIYPNLAGKVKLNSNINSVYDLYPKKNIYKVIVFDEIKQSKHIDISLHNKDYSMRITPKCRDNKNTNCLIDKITIIDPSFIVYDTGIHVGMTLDDLILLYGKLKLTWKDSHLAVTNNDGIYFILDAEQIPKWWFDKKNSTLNQLPIKTKIKAIYLTST